jgi:CheY-like chemotaxis protein
LDGRDLYYELRSRPDTCNIPIVVVTGSDTSDLDSKVFTSILRKPIEMDELVKAVDEARRSIQQ